MHQKLPSAPTWSPAGCALESPGALKEDSGPILQKRKLRLREGLGSAGQDSVSSSAGKATLPRPPGFMGAALSVSHLNPALQEWTLGALDAANHPQG